MFSFGYVLWELRYDETSFRDAIDSRTEIKVPDDVVKHDLRPTHTEGTQPPWGELATGHGIVLEQRPKVKIDSPEGMGKAAESKYITTSTTTY